MPGQVYFGKKCVSIGGLGTHCGRKLGRSFDSSKSPSILNIMVRFVHESEEHSGDCAADPGLDELIR
jgi:hypothetical protein